MSIEDNEALQNQRPLEAGIHTDLEGRMTYGGYLQLGRLLSAHVQRTGTALLEVLAKTTLSRPAA